MKLALVTLTIGGDYTKLAKVTHPYLRAYAVKIGARFITITDQRLARTHPSWERFRMYELFDVYDRILYIDTDALVRPDCPNLFKLVPESAFGGFNEASVIDRKGNFELVQQQYKTPIENWDGKYYNMGVSVFSAKHKPMFAYPGVEHDNLFEQSYLNLMLYKHKFEVFEFSHEYNRMSVMDGHDNRPRSEHYIVHHAGSLMPDKYKHMATDIDSWRKRGITL